MTRFNISLAYAVEVVMWSLKNLIGGELLIPKLPSYKIMDLAKAISPKCKTPIIGIRPGEKIHEEMISSSDSQNTLEIKDFFIILPGIDKKILSIYKNKFGAKKVKKGFIYRSDSNDQFLTIKELNQLVIKFQKNL